MPTLLDNRNNAGVSKKSWYRRACRVYAGGREFLVGDDNDVATWKQRCSLCHAASGADFLFLLAIEQAYVNAIRRLFFARFVPRPLGGRAAGYKYRNIVAHAFVRIEPVETLPRQKPRGSLGCFHGNGFCTVCPFLVDHVSDCGLGSFAEYCLFAVACDIIPLCAGCIYFRPAAPVNVVRRESAGRT